MKQTQYQTKMQELGLTTSTISKGIQSDIAALTNAQSALEDATSKKDASLIAEIEADIDVMDNDLIVALEKYAAKRPAMLANAAKMLAAKNAKKNIVVTPAPAEEPIPEPPVIETIAPIVEETPPLVEEQVAEPVDEEKKGGGIGWFFGLLGVGVLAALGIKAYNDRG